MNKRGIIVGFGNMGLTHFEHLTAQGAQIVAVVDPEESRRALAVERSILAFPSLADVPAATRRCVDFVVIATPTPSHARLCEQALEFAPHVLLEKPAVRTVKEVEHFLAMTVGNARVFVAEVEQYNPAFTGFMQLSRMPHRVEFVRSVDIDYFLRGRRAWFLDEEQSGGLVLDVLIHDISLLVLKYGRPQVERVETAPGRYTRADSARITLVYPTFTAIVCGTWVAAGQPTPIEATILVEWDDRHPFVAHCRDYTIRDKPSDKDAFARQAQAFMNVVRGKQATPPIRPYLEAVLVALEVNQKIRAQG